MVADLNREEYSTKILLKDKYLKIIIFNLRIFFSNIVFNQLKIIFKILQVFYK